MFNQSRGLPPPQRLICPECKNNRFRWQSSKITCTNCGWSEKTSNMKYGSRRTEARDGIKRDSKFEASVADELLLRKKGGDILDYENQFMVEMDIYRADGVKAFTVRHKVDFRVHLRDKSYELLEAKGVETPDWKWRKRLLEQLWLPLHKDHTYRVVKQ